MHLLSRFPFVYNGGPFDLSEWEPGEERDVSEEAASYLLREFPGLWEIVEPARGASVEPVSSNPSEPSGGPAMHAAITSAPVDRGMRSPGVLASKVLDDHAARVASAIRNGEHDQDLAALLQAERGGKARKSVIEAIEERADSLQAG